ncbi:hypothetical protein GGI35DRAFT_455111 [Trichoderma velutinum]
MGQTFYDIDPNGDTLLILENANAPFAVLPSPTPQEEQKAPDSTADDDATRETKETENNLEDGDTEAKDVDTKSLDEDTKPTIRMRLSSKHLTLASAYFQKLTSNNWKETTPEAGYSYVIKAHDWDEEALLVLMNIVHGRTAKVPRSVNLEMLAKIAVLVDYYQCHEIVAFFAETWVYSSSITVPKEGERDFMLRLVVSVVFSEDFKFSMLTRTIIQKSMGRIDSLGLPIPQAIIDALNKKREDALRGAISGLHALKKRLCEDDSCSFECSSIYLGALIKAMNKMRLMDPLPSRSFPGRSLLTLEQAIRDIKEPVWNTNCQGPSASTKTTTVAGGLFGSLAANSSTTATPPARGLFGNPPANPTTNTTLPSGGLFGTRSTNPNTDSSPGGLFGSPPVIPSTNTTPPAGGLFGNLPANSSTNATPTAGGLFGNRPASSSANATPSSGGALFNLPASTSTNTTSTTGGLFGSARPASSSANTTSSSGGALFNLAASTSTNTTPLTGGLFGNRPASPSITITPSTSSIFDNRPANSSASATSATAGLFGGARSASPSTNTTSTIGGLFGSARPTSPSANTTTSGVNLFNLPASTSTNTTPPTGGLFSTTPSTAPSRPVCNLAEKTMPIIEELLGKTRGLELKDFVGEQW